MRGRGPRRRRWRGSAWSDSAFGLLATIILMALGLGLIIAAGICVAGTVR
ncbi:hypothetical protein [Sinomonas atrocyanea]